MTQKIASSFIIASVLPWIALVVSPMLMYIGNRAQYAAATPLVTGFAGAFLLTSLAFWGLLRAASSRPKAYRVLAGLFVGLALGAWVQGHILVWDFGPLDGRGLPWHKFTGHERLEIALWSIIVLITVYVFFKQHALARSLPLAIWVLGTISLVSSIFIHDVPSPKPSSSAAARYPTVERALEFHKTNNTVIILLDSYQSDAFFEILEKHPDETAFLDGFVFYPNTLSGYPTTRHSLPLILTGKYYRNDFPYNSENRDSFEDPSLASFFAEKKYGVAGDFENLALSAIGKDKVFPSALRESHLWGITESQIKAIDIGLFRSSPIFLKKIFYDEGRWFLSKLTLSEDAPPAPHGDDWRFVTRFTSAAGLGSDNQGEFKFIHLMAPHLPLSVDESFRYVPGLEDTRANYVNQARGALGLARRLVARLKELGIYRSAEIVIAADHGANNRPPIDLVGDERDLAIPLSHISAARPLLLYKEAGAAGALRTSDQPMHLSYIPCLISKGDVFDCEDFANATAGKPVIRSHYRYEWAYDFWFKDYSPPMTLYEVHGDVRRIASWKSTHVVFENGERRELRRSYQVGSKVEFGSAGTSGNFIESGWSGTEPTHRWTEGEVARLSFEIPDLTKEDLVLKLEGRGFSPDGVRPQRVAVLANGHSVGDWSMLGRASFSAIIPRKAIADNKLALAFEIGEPTSPHEIAGTSDRRRLGFAVFSLSLHPLIDE